MDKPILKDSMKLFEALGTIKSRSMFGGFGLFADETMFALVVNNQLHIRADQQTSSDFETQGLKPYVYKNVASQSLLSTTLFPANYGNLAIA